MRHIYFSRRVFGQLLVDALLVVLATLGAFLIRYDVTDPSSLLHREIILHSIPILWVSACFLSTPSGCTVSTGGISPCTTFNS